MRRRLALAAIAAGIVFADMAQAGMARGTIVALDREKQLVQLADGSIYYLPNRAFFKDFRSRRWVKIWYSVENGVRVVRAYDIKRRKKRDGS